jgi:hypothetical protein
MLFLISLKKLYRNQDSLRTLYVARGFSLGK